MRLKCKTAIRSETRKEKYFTRIDPGQCGHSTEFLKKVRNVTCLITLILQTLEAEGMCKNQPHLQMGPEAQRKELTDFTHLLIAELGGKSISLGSIRFSFQCKGQKTNYFKQNSNSFIPFLINVTYRVSYIKGYYKKFIKHAYV